MECSHTLIWYIGTDNIRLSRCQVCLNLLLGQMKTMLVVRYDLLTADILLERLQPLLITEAVICLPLLDQLLCIFHIKTALATLTLNIRTIAAILIRTFIMLQACLVQCTVNDLQRLIKKTLLIGIFYSKYKIAALMLCDQICV